jgi:peptidoglycan hydrolase CwlO-like protein
MVDNVLKNESYGQSIDIRLKYISESKQRFLTETRLYAAWDIHETLATAKKVESNVQSLRDDFDKVTPAMQAMNSNIGFLVEKIRYAECMYMYYIKKV